MLKKLSDIKSGIVVLLICSALYVAYRIGATGSTGATKGELQTEMVSLIESRKKSAASAVKERTNIEAIGIRLDSAAKALGRMLSKPIVPLVPDSFPADPKQFGVDKMYEMAWRYQNERYGQVGNMMAEFTNFYYEKFNGDYGSVDQKLTSSEQLRFDAGKEAALVLQYGKWFGGRTDSLVTVNELASLREQVVAFYAPERVKENLTALKGKLEGLAQQAANLAGTIKSETDESIAGTNRLETELTEIQDSGRDRVTLTVALPIFGAIVVLILIVPALYHSGSSSQSDIVLEQMFDKGLLLRLFTVFILTVAIMILGIGGQIKGETLGTLLGAISAYVLQSSFSKEEGKNGKPNGDGTDKPTRASTSGGPQPGAASTIVGGAVSS